MPNFFEIFLKFLTNQNFWGCTFTPAPAPLCMASTVIAKRNRVKREVEILWLLAMRLSFSVALLIFHAKARFFKSEPSKCGTTYFSYAAYCTTPVFKKRHFFVSNRPAVEVGNNWLSGISKNFHDHFSRQLDRLCQIRFRHYIQPLSMLV